MLGINQKMLKNCLIILLILITSCNQFKYKITSGNNIYFINEYKVLPDGEITFIINDNTIKLKDYEIQRR